MCLPFTERPKPTKEPDLDRYRLMIRAFEALRPYALHLAGLAVAVVLGITVAGVKIAADPPSIDTADRWPFPKWEAYRASQLRQNNTAAQLWAVDPAKAKVAAEIKVAGPPWRFIGTLQEGNRRVAVLELDQGKRIQRIGSGEALPNGGLIKKIEASELTYDEGGIEKVLRLFGVAKTEGIADGNGKN